MIYNYTRFEIAVLPILFVYISLFLLSIFMTIKLIKKWRERKVPAPLHLSLVYMTMTIGAFILMIGLLEAVITGYYMEIYRFSLPMAYSCVVLWNIFLFLFISGITEKGKRALIPIILIGIGIIIALFLPTNWWGYPSEEYAGKLNTRLYSTVSLVIYSIIIYISIFLICQKAKQKTSDKISRVGLSLLAYAMICMLLWFFFIILDTILIVFTNHPGYSIFVYIAWIFAFIFMAFTYISLIMPDWFVRWIEKREELKNK